MIGSGLFGTTFLTMDGGEIKNLIIVWSTVVASLCYCHAAANFLPPKHALTRALAILPIVSLFFLLPFNLTSVTLGTTSCFFIAWLASFKLFLFALGLGPLASSPPLPLSSFIPLACLPIKFRKPVTVSGPGSTVLAAGRTVDSGSDKTRKSSSVGRAVKLVLLAVLIRGYGYRERMHPKVVLVLYGLHIYFVLELALVAVGYVAGRVSGVELDPPFDEPHLATSLQDFWGRRWNLMVTNIMRPAVYGPVRSAWARIVPGRWARLAAVMATFLVSGVMHEFVFYHMGREKPSGEVLCFFLLHGACLCVEIWIKKSLDGKFKLAGYVSGPLVLSFIMVTSFWLFFPPMLKNKVDVKACNECLAFIETLKHHKLVSPNNITCPFF
ncbi:unnamed protein product [Cuscuta campestris]|uniref:Wax synthase domain-containing protein n=1 Tax=Cuscuta campestris TaxID=132261 RepID=A0A484K5I3_9ASTE|nr:unnamed protein product [Cuscuta campestris]